MVRKRWMAPALRRTYEGCVSHFVCTLERSARLRRRWMAPALRQAVLTAYRESTRERSARLRRRWMAPALRQGCVSHFVCEPCSLHTEKARERGARDFAGGGWRQRCVKGAFRILYVSRAHCIQRKHAREERETSQEADGASVASRVRFAFCM
jgi:hypothetical protein